MLLKREDLNHTGAHKINNTIGQALLARRMGKRRIIAETGAGQHGVATATVCARFGLECVVYMGAEDVARQALNVYRMQLLGATVVPVESGTRTLKDATNEALRDWVTNVPTTHYIIGSVVGPDPYPAHGARLPVGDRPRGAGADAGARRPAARARWSRASGGGSNAMGIFSRLPRRSRGRAGRRRGGGRGHRDRAPQRHAHGAGRPGVLHGSLSYLLQDDDGQVLAGALGLGGARLSRRGAGAQLAARQRAGALRVGRPTPRRWSASSRSAGWRGSSPRSRPRTRSPGCCGQRGQLAAG